MLGSVQDAVDLLQETLLAAWRGLDLFAGRPLVRTWLYRIATNRRLNALRDKGAARALWSQKRSRSSRHTDRADVAWAYPDALLGTAADTSPGPEAP